MRRFMGMMPSSEVEKRAVYKDKYGEEVRIDAGPNGWTVYYVDYSTNYKDEVLTTEENFNNAYEVASDNVGPLTPITWDNYMAEDVDECDCEEG